MSFYNSSSLIRAWGLAFLLMGWPTTHLQAVEQQGTSVIGSWKLTTVLDSSDIASLDDREADQLIGHVITISRNKVQLDDRICDAPDFEVTKAETNKFFRDQAHAHAKKLGLPNPVIAVHVSCTEVYIKSRNRLVVHWKGFFFDAVRIPGKSL